MRSPCEEMIYGESRVVISRYCACARESHWLKEEGRLSKGVGDVLRAALLENPEVVAVIAGTNQMLKAEM